MNEPTPRDSDSEFYIGWQPEAPAHHARFNRRVVLGTLAGAALLAALAAWSLPYFGAGRFEFGTVREYHGELRTSTAPRLQTAHGEFLLVGAGKHGVPLEICGLDGHAVKLAATLIERDGHPLLEVDGAASATGRAAPEMPSVRLGEATLTGEIVDSKCYFGVMNPGEGLLHRACAVQCLRGGVPPVFAARDPAGATRALLLAGPNGEPVNDALLRWVGQPLRVSGTVWRTGQWLVLRIDPAMIAQ